MKKETTKDYSKYNTMNVLAEVEKKIAELESERHYWSRKLYIYDVCNELSIFDWWNDYLSVSQLKQMRSFLKTAHKLGYDGYVCFKVGAKYCANGMWAHKEETTDGYSPKCDCIYHSFVNGANDWAYCADGLWSETVDGLREFKKVLAEASAK